MVATRSLRKGQAVNRDRGAVRFGQRRPVEKQERNGRAAALIFGFLAALVFGAALTIPVAAQNLPPRNEEQERRAAGGPRRYPQGRHPGAAGGPCRYPQGRCPAAAVRRSEGSRGRTRRLTEERRARSRQCAEGRGGPGRSLEPAVSIRRTKRRSPDPARPDVVTQYRVATRDTLKVLREKSQGAP